MRGAGFLSDDGAAVLSSRAVAAEGGLKVELGRGSYRFGEAGIKTTFALSGKLGK
jgi:hypothetical protein